MTRQLNARDLGELDARDFLGDEEWRKIKMRYDECMGFRKTLKGKPTDEQRLQLLLNACDIESAEFMLWHSARLTAHNRCTCIRCDHARQGKEPQATANLLKFLEELAK